MGLWCLTSKMPPGEKQEPHTTRKLVLCAGRVRLNECARPARQVPALALGNLADFVAPAVDNRDSPRGTVASNQSGV
jgi:hypothetical protein